jgi:hypothetical protein
VESRQDLPMDRRNKPALIPGDAANSLLVRLTRHEGPPNDPMPTPSKRERLSDADISMTERWVQAGAIMSSDFIGKQTLALPGRDLTERGMDTPAFHTKRISNCEADDARTPEEQIDQIKRLERLVAELCYKNQVLRNCLMAIERSKTHTQD